MLGTLLVACFSKTNCRPRSVGESPSGCCLQVGTLLRHLASNFTNSVMMTTMTIMMMGTMTTTTMTMKVMSFTSSAIWSHKLTNGAAKSSASMFLLISSTYDFQSVVANLIKTFHRPNGQRLMWNILYFYFHSFQKMWNGDKQRLISWQILD